jgi:hypothetical protein
MFSMDRVTVSRRSRGREHVNAPGGGCRGIGVGWLRFQPLAGAGTGARAPAEAVPGVSPGLRAGRRW